MQIILLEKVANLGSLGDIVKVKDGFGRNFLIPQGKAKRATESNSAKLAAYVLKVSQKAGVDGRLFGSVTNGDIAEGLVAAGFEVVKSEVRLPTGPLKTIGDHAVSVALHHDIVVDITVTVTPEA
jgi:large subunit ribosomal protein L9